MLHKKISNKLVGVGGMRCSCCAPQGVKSRREFKRKLNRCVRNVLNFDQDIEEGEWFNYWTQTDPSDVMDIGQMDEAIEWSTERELGPIYIVNFSKEYLDKFKSL